MNFEIIKKNYERKLWSGQMVAKALEKGAITEEQFKEITGSKYVAVAE